MGKFKLVNPVIIGSFKSTYESSNALDAAKQFWNELTENNYITNNVPQFLFTLEDVKDKSLHHCVVKESAAGNSKFTDFNIEKVNVDLSSQQKTDFLSEVNKVTKQVNNKVNKQTGGKSRKRYKDDSSSSSDDSDDEDDYLRSIRLKRLKQPIVYWWYSPNIYGVRTIFTPTFVSPLHPYVQLWVPTR